MHQEEVEVFHSAGLKLQIYQRSDVPLRFEVLICELVSQNVFAAVMSGREALPYRDLAQSVMISMRGIEIVESHFEEAVHHSAYLLIVDLAVDHRQSHHSECQMLFILPECSVTHISSLCFLRKYYSVYQIACDALILFITSFSSSVSLFHSGS